MLHGSASYERGSCRWLAAVRLGRLEATRARACRRAAVRQFMLLMHAWTLQRARVGLLGCGADAATSVGTEPRGHDFAGNHVDATERSQATVVEHGPHPP